MPSGQRLPDMKQLTIQQAADLLNVSCDYVRRLIDSGALGEPAQAAGRRYRIPLQEVQRAQVEMKDARRAALDSLNAHTAEAREREDATAGSPIRRWVKA